MMKSLCSFALASLFVLTAASADITIVQKVEGGAATEITMKVKGDKARVDVNPQISTILDAKTGEILNVVHAQKMVMRISGEKAKAMAEMAKAMVKEEIPDLGAPKATGKKQTIQGYEASEFVTDSPKFHASYWVATTYPNYQEVLKQMALLKKGAFAAITKGMPDYQALPGLPLRTEVKIQGQPDMVSTIQSVSLNPLPDSDFVVPAGYTEMALPDMLAQPPGGKTP